MSISPAVRDPDTQVIGAGPLIQHYIILAVVYADSPTRAKLMKCLSGAAYLGCGRCWMTGQQLYYTMRWAGYASSVTASRGLLDGQQVCLLIACMHSLSMHENMVAHLKSVCPDAFTGAQRNQELHQHVSQVQMGVNDVVRMVSAMVCGQWRGV